MILSFFEFNIILKSLNLWSSLNKKRKNMLKNKLKNNKRNKINSQKPTFLIPEKCKCLIVTWVRRRKNSIYVVI